MSDAIIWLDAAAPDAAGIGGKGASLLRLTQAGFPVPAGFVLTADAYRRWVASNALVPLIDALAATPDLRLPKIAREASAALRAAANGPLPEDVQRTLLDAYAALRERCGPGVAVAVRSSALSEDGAHASSAGLYETVLNVRDAPALVAAVLTCYRSLWAARAVQYRAVNGLGQRNEAMAVVVMQMVPAEVAGVAFTANPISGSADEVVINASWGLGEAIVSGRVTPDSFVVRKQDRAVLSRDVYEKELVIAPDPSGASGTVAIAVPAARQQTATLDDAQLAKLVELCLAVERRHGAPQDIEWALCRDTFFLLQSRPITGMH